MFIFLNDFKQLRCYALLDKAKDIANTCPAKIVPLLEELLRLRDNEEKLEQINEQVKHVIEAYEQIHKRKSLAFYQEIEGRKRVEVMLTMRDVREIMTTGSYLGTDIIALCKIIERQQEALNRIKEHAYHGTFVGMHLDGDVVYNIARDALLWH